MKKEEKIYSNIRNLLADEIDYFAFKEKVRVFKMGEIDIVLIVDIGGEFSQDIEVISIEVKLDRKNIMNKLAQSLKYSLLTDRCYLAVKLNKNETFSYEERYLAQSLGIGLIEYKPSLKYSKIVNESKKFTPLNSKKEELLRERFEIFKCSICGNYIPLLKEIPCYWPYNIDLSSDWLEHGKPGKRRVSFKRSKKDKYRESRICKSCCKMIRKISKTECDEEHCPNKI